MSVWSLLEECVGQLDEPFRRSEIVGWFRRHHPEVRESTLAAHIQAATGNSANRARNHPNTANRPPLLQRVSDGVYVRADPSRPVPGVRAPASRSKYDPLRRYLAERAGGEVTMTFAEVEKLVGQLPPSARNHRAWWANGTHTEAQAWMGAGWRVRSVNLPAMKVIFARGITGLAPQRKPAAPGRPPAYINAQVVASISAKAGERPQLDCTKLLRLISELNDNYSQGNGYGAHTLLRAILDHIPPMFGCKNFAAVVNNYRWNQTDKAYMRKLHDFKLQADDVLHRPMSPTPDLLSLDDMPPRAWVNRLLQESASQPAPLIDQTRSAHAAEQQPMPAQPHSAPRTDRAAQKRLSSEGPRSAPWTVREVLEAVVPAGDDQAEVARAVCDWATAHPHIRITGGTGRIDPAIMMSADTGQRGSRSPVVLYLVVYGRPGGGLPKLEIRVNEMCGTPPYTREELQARLTSELHAIGIPRLDAQDFFKRPNIPLTDLTSGRVQRLLSVVDRWIKDTRLHAGEPASRH